MKRVIYFGCFLLIVSNFLFITAAIGDPIFIFDEDLSTLSSESHSRIDYPSSLAASKKFINILGKVAVEDFEKFSDKEKLPLTVNFDGFTNANLSGNSNQIFYIEDPTESYYGTFPISGNNFLKSNGSFVIEFEKEQFALGFFVTDYEKYPVQLTFENQSGNVKTYKIQHTIPSKSGSVTFWGVVDKTFPFYKVIISGANSKDGFAFDNIIIPANDKLTYISGCTAITEKPITHGKVMLMQSGEIFQSISLDENGCYKFYDFNEKKPFSIVIRKTDDEH